VEKGRNGDNANALQTFIVTLGIPGEWERLEYERDTRPKVGEAILLSDGRWASVDDIVPMAEGSSLLECQRLYRLLLIDMDANPVEPGEMLSDQRSYRELETLLIDSTGERLRVRGFEHGAPEGYDGVVIVEPFPG